MFMAHDDDNGNDEFENNFDRRELLVMFEELASPITENEVVRSAKQLKSNKSPGPDLLINELFIHDQNVLIKHYTILFNKTFESGHLPTCWSKGIIVPVHKNGLIHEVENYRVITLLSVFGKLFTHILNITSNEWG